MKSYSIYPVCRNCYEAYLRQGGGIDRTHNGVCRRRIFASGLPMQIDDNRIPCSICDDPFTGSPFPDYDQMHLYLFTEEEIMDYFVDVVGAKTEA